MFSVSKMDMSEDEFTGIDRFVQQKCLVEPVITAQNLSSIYQCPDQQMYRARIQFLFSLDQHAFDEASRDTLIDMIHNAILFASDNDFSYPKSIVFLSIYVAVFQLASSSPFYLPKKLYKRYENLLLAHAVDRPPRSTQIFELADIKLIHEFFINTFFRNLKLIINSFTQKQFISFKTQFSVKVPVPELPPLVDMELVTPNKPEEEGSALQNDDSSSKLRSPKSPRSPRSPRQQVTERSAPKPKEQAREASPVPEQLDTPEDRGPEVPIDLLRGSLQSMHEKFVFDFEEKERLLMGKIKELEIRLQEKPQLKKPPVKKK